MTPKKKQTKTPNPRTRQVIDQEYTNLAAKYGHQTVQCQFLNDEINSTYSKMIELSREAANLPQEG